MSECLQMAKCWHQILVARDSFGGKALLSMGIDALVAWTLECLLRNLGSGKGSSIVESERQRRPPKGGRYKVNTLSHRFSE